MTGAYNCSTGRRAYWLAAQFSCTSSCIAHIQSHPLTVWSIMWPQRKSLYGSDKARLDTPSHRLCQLPGPTECTGPQGKAYMVRRSHQAIHEYRCRKRNPREVASHTSLHACRHAENSVQPSTYHLAFYVCASIPNTTILDPGSLDTEMMACLLLYNFLQSRKQRGDTKWWLSKRPGL